MRGWKGWLYATMVAILIFSGFYWYHQRHLQTADSVTWYSKNPVSGPRHSDALTIAGKASAKSVGITLLPGSVSGAEWYLPVTPSSAVSYVLHDGQGRWVTQGHHYALASGPTDPVGALSAAPNGLSIAWTRHNQIRWLKSDGTVSLIPHGHSVNLIDRGLEYVVTAGTTHQVVSPYGTHFVQYDTKSSPTPFVNQGTSFVYDNHGTVSLMTLATGSTRPLFSVKALHWPSLKGSVGFAQGIAVLLSRQTPVPSYLLAVVTAKHTYWYRWPASTTPELGVSTHGKLIIAGIEPNLVVYGARGLHPLPYAGGIFSSGPMGVVLPTGRGGFQRLFHITP